MSAVLIRERPGTRRQQRLSLFLPAEISWLLVEASSLMAARGRQDGWLAEVDLPVLRQVGRDPRLVHEAATRLGAGARLLRVALGRQHARPAPLEGPDELVLTLELGGPDEPGTVHADGSVAHEDAIVLALTYGRSGLDLPVSACSAGLWAPAAVCAG